MRQARYPFASSLSLAAVIAILHGSAPPVADADSCAGIRPSYSVSVPDGPLTVPLEGVLVLEARRAGSIESGAGQLGELTVSDDMGEPVSGTVETRLLAEWTELSPPTVRQQELIVWRADAPLEPGAPYDVEISWTTADYAEPETARLSATAANDATAPVQARDVGEVTAERRKVSVDGSVACDGCDCRFSDREQMTALETTVDVSDDPRWVVHRLVADDGSTIDRDAVVWGGAEEPRTAQLYVRDRAETYCLRVETQDLIEGTAQVSEPVCVQDPGGSGGCAAAGRGGAGGTAAVALALVAGVCARRRRLRGRRGRA